MRKFFNCTVFLMAIALISCNWWASIWGNNILGNNLSLLEGDKKEDRIIVYCEGDCHGGIYVVPTYARHYDSNGRYAEYVEMAKSNKEWVIVKTLRIKEKQENYWIISKEFSLAKLDCSKNDCDSILQKQVIGPLALKEFQNKLQVLNIDLNFK